MALFGGLFGKKNNLAALEKMSVKDLEQEQVRLESQQDSIIAKVKELEKQKDAVLKEGAKKSSTLERKAMAVRYKQLDAEAKDYTSQTSLISKQIRIIGRMVQMKRREALLKKEGLWSTMSAIDATDLEQFMLDMRARSKEGDAEASRLLEILDEPIAAEAEEEDEDVRAIMEAMEAVSEAEAGEVEIEEIKKQLEKGQEEEEATEA